MTSIPHPPYSFRFWPAYVVQMRPYLLFVSGAAGLTGIAAGYSGQVSDFTLWFSFLPLFLGYGFGQALTDCFQTDTDKISAPYRPLSKGSISVRGVKLVSITVLLAGVGLLIYFNPWNILPGVLSVIGLAMYTFFKRRYWFAGPVWNGWIVALLPLMGYMSVAGGSMLQDFKETLPLLCISFFAYTHFVITGYLKDIEADRSTGYRTFPVVFGWNATVWVGDLLVLAAALFSSFVLSDTPAGWVWIAATLVAVSGQLYGHFTRDKTEKNTAFPVAATVRAFIAWHISVVLYYQETWWPYLLLFYMLFEWALYRRPEKNQI